MTRFVDLTEFFGRERTRLDLAEVIAVSPVALKNYHIGLRFRDSWRLDVMLPHEADQAAEAAYQRFVTQWERARVSAQK